MNSSSIPRTKEGMAAIRKAMIDGIVSHNEYCFTAA
jgi:hypothetical protein